MKKTAVLIVLIILLLACGTVAYAESAPPSPTGITSAAAFRSGDTLSAPSGSVIPQPAQPLAEVQNAQIAQYVIYAVAIAVVVVLLVVFRRKYKRKKDDE